MAQHFTRATVSAAFFCKRCNKETQHRIDGVRKGPCLECIARPIQKKEVAKYSQTNLFVEDGA